MAGAAHLSKGNAGVPRSAQQKGNPLSNKRAKAGSIGASSAGDNCESTAYRFLLSGVPSVEQEVSDKLPLGKLACGSKAFVATLLFDPSILALPIIATQKSPSAGLFTHRKALQELNLLQTVQQVTSLPSQPEAKTSADLLSMMTCFMDWESSLWCQLLDKMFISSCR